MRFAAEPHPLRRPSRLREAEPACRFTYALRAGHKGQRRDNARADFRTHPPQQASDNRRQVISSPARRKLRALPPSGNYQVAPGVRPFARSSHTRCEPSGKAAARASRSIDRRNSPPRQSARLPERGRGRPHGVLAPIRTTTFNREPALAMSSPASASHVAADRPHTFAPTSRSAGRCRGSPEVPIARRPQHHD